MQYKTINQDFLLNKITSTDIFFAGDYTIDPYQNCEFGCLYCDSSFDKTIYIKSNAVEILTKQLQNLEKKTIIVGSVHDPYQKAEEKYKLTRNILKTIKKHGFTCHILTKSDLILRDIDMLSEIKNCIVTISLISLDDSVASIFEKNAPSPKQRLQIIEKLSNNGIKAGVAIIPILPFIVEYKSLEKIIKESCKKQAQYILYKHLELKGDQKNIFFEVLKNFYPNLVNQYEELYKDSYMPKQTFIKNLNKTLNDFCKKYNIKNKV
jgi:DNA repair photolyase